MENNPVSPTLIPMGDPEKKQQTRIFNISFKSFVLALIMLALLMIGTYALTFVVPAGEFSHVDGSSASPIIPGTYEEVPGGISFGKWLASPVLILFSSDNITILAITFFLLVIGGAFSALDSAGILSYMLGSLYERFNKHKYTLLAIITLCFMLLGSLIGSFEEVVPLVPIAVALAYALRWDALVGLGMSLMAVGCGFSCGITNPFTVGVAQQYAGLPLFSGISLRVLSFILVYGVLLIFLNVYARKIEKRQDKSLVYNPEANLRWIEIQYEFKYDKKKARALRWFAFMMFIGIGVIISSAFVSTLSSIVMPVVGVVFLVAGTITALVSGMKLGKYLSSFFKGVLNVLPAVLLLLMASSVKYVLTESKTLDTLLYYGSMLTENINPLLVVLVIYAITFVINLFVPSGSAEAALLIPLLAPLAQLTGISTQLVVLSFIFGDGFSDLFFPTSPIMLIALGLVGVSYGKWLRWSLKIQLVILAITIGVLAIGQYFGYLPFIGYGV